jgi:hypothetical protein
MLEIFGVSLWHFGKLKYVSLDIDWMCDMIACFVTWFGCFSLMSEM